MNASLSSSSFVSEASSFASEDLFGRRLAARLDAGGLELPPDTAERLRAARMQALARRNVLQPRTASTVVAAGTTATLGTGWWTRIASVVPQVALVAGLLAVGVIQDDNQANETAAIDAALLTDELPPIAYTDPGFAQFLRADEATTAPR